MHCKCLLRNQTVSVRKLSENSCYAYKSLSASSGSNTFFLALCQHIALPCTFKHKNNKYAPSRSSTQNLIVCTQSYVLNKRSFVQREN